MKNFKLSNSYISTHLINTGTTIHAWFSLAFIDINFAFFPFKSTGTVTREAVGLINTSCIVETRFKLAFVDVVGTVLSIETFVESKINTCRGSYYRF